MVSTPQTGIRRAIPSLTSERTLRGYAVQTIDGNIGQVRELYFDDVDWTVRHIVIDTSHWLPGCKVLLPPTLVKSIRSNSRELLVGVTRRQVKDSPSVDTDKPVARQHRAEERARSNWTMYLAGEAITAAPEAIAVPVFEPSNKNGKPFDPHLRTKRIVGGLTLCAADGVARRIVDFLIDDTNWVIQYLVVAVRARKHVLLRPRFVREILIEERAAMVELPVEAISTNPAYDLAVPPARAAKKDLADHDHAAHAD